MANLFKAQESRYDDGTKMFLANVLNCPNFFENGAQMLNRTLQ